MHRNTRLERLKALERAALDEATEEWARQQLRPHGVPEWVGGQVRLWRARFVALAAWAQDVVKIGAALTMLGTGYKLVRLMWARVVGSPDMQATGIHSTALDRVEKSAAGDGAAEPPRRR